MSDNAVHPVCLVAFKSDGGRRVLALKPGRYTIGRHESAALRLPFPSVSRKHCELSCEGSVLTVRDLGSSNGTFRNAEQLPPQSDTQLEAGDTLSVGPCQFVVQINGEPANVQPPAAGVDEMLQPPPQGSPAQGGAQQQGSEVDADLDETIAKPSSGMGGLLGENPDDSSIFDFDFDFEDDDNPKL